LNRKSPSRSLLYVSEESPGIRRLRRGKGFHYQLPNGRLIPAGSSTYLRIKSLVIPPAWTDVWISPKANSHIQATGRDQRGRKQYLYHSLWTEQQNVAKFGRLLSFARKLPALRRRIRRDQKLRGISREKMLAVVVALLDKTFIRVGNDEYARTNGSFGLTTLRNRHVRVKGETIEFRFSGKSGQAHRITLTDRRLARTIHRCQELPGQELFSYIGTDGRLHAINSRDVNAYLRQLTGEEYTAKDFRTWHGTVTAVAAFQSMMRESLAPTLPTIVKRVATALGNTPAVSRKSYIHPNALRLIETPLPVPLLPSIPRGLSADERLTLAVLRARRLRTQAATP